MAEGEAAGEVIPGRTEAEGTLGLDLERAITITEDRVEIEAMTDTRTVGITEGETIAEIEGMMTTRDLPGHLQVLMTDIPKEKVIMRTVIEEREITKMIIIEDQLIETTESQGSETKGKEVLETTKTTLKMTGLKAV